MKNSDAPCQPGPVSKGKSTTIFSTQQSLIPTANESAPKGKQRKKTTKSTGTRTTKNCAPEPTGNKERDLQKYLVNLLKYHYRQGVYIINQRGGIGQRRGIPDLVICYQGRYLAIEVKSPKGNGYLTDYQKKELEDIKFAGGWTMVIDSYEQADMVIKSISYTTK